MLYKRKKVGEKLYFFKVFKMFFFDKLHFFAHFPLCNITIWAIFNRKKDAESKKRATTTEAYVPRDHCSAYSSAFT